jgi:hypothetical protein
MLYLPYVAFQPHEWHYTRFLLPGLVVMLLMAVAIMLGGVRLLMPEARGVVTGALVIAVMVFMARFALENGAFHLYEAERKYPAAGAYVRNRMGPGAAVLAVQHSGSLRLYAGSLTVRWDLVHPSDIDRVIDALRARGGTPVLVLDPGEVEAFAERFSGSRAARTMTLLGVVEETRVYAFE